MLKNVAAICLMVIISVGASVLTTILLNMRNGGKARQTQLIQTQTIELVDDHGRVKGSFGLTRDKGGTLSLPKLALKDQDGRDSIVMFINPDGNGILGFANEHWNEGAVILGRLDSDDVDDPAGHTREALSKSGGWGLQVRSPSNRFTSVGFWNSGQAMSPLPAESTPPGDPGAGLKSSNAVHHH